MNYKYGISVVGLLVIIGLSGCSSKLVKEEQYSGFLPDYSQLKMFDTASGDVTLRWISDEISEGNYGSVLLEKTVLYPAPAPSEQVSQSLLTQLSWTVDKALARAVGTKFELVDKAGEGVLRLKPAITGVAHSMEGMRPVEILPIALVIGLTKAATGTRDRDVEVFLEVAVEDSVSGKLLAAAVRKGEGDQLENDNEQLTMPHLNKMVENWEKDTEAVVGKLAN